MAEAVVMPQMGYDMEKGTVVAWLKREGDTVSQHEAIVEIETDKAVVEIEAPVSGSLLRIVVPDGVTVATGKAIGYIGKAGESVPEAGPEQARATATTVAAPAEVPPTASGSPEVGARHLASPIARRIAEERGVDLSQVRGTGPGGRITKDDVLAVAEVTTGSAEAPEAPTPAPTGGLGPRTPGADGTIPIGKMGQAIARRTQATVNEAPHFYLTARVDMTDAMAWRERINQALGPDERLSVNDLVMKACALALTKHPVFNSTYEGEQLRVHPKVNMGMAVALPEGLIVPAVLGCESKSVTQIASAARDLASRAKTGRLRQEEYTGTFSVSNLGMFGVEAFTAIIVSPQVAVLAVGEVQDAIVSREGGIYVRKMMSATLSTDHRAANGVEAALFAGEIRRLLEHPEELGR